MNNDMIIRMREKWRELPSTRYGRNFSSEMLGWSDEELIKYWEKCRMETTTLEVRGWFQDLYKEKMAGCRVADVGPGIGIDGIYFAEQGAKVTFVDIVIDNLKLIERICKLKNIEADYYYIDDFFNYNFKSEFDIFMFIGSMHHAPFEFAQKQIKAITKFLRPNGKVLMLTYPKERFIKSGANSFEEFGKKTDGESTPWAEWYDDNKICKLFGDDFRLNWSRNFGQDNIEFNWFDLTKSVSERNKSYNFIDTNLNKYVRKNYCVLNDDNTINILKKDKMNIRVLIFGAGKGGESVYKDIIKINNEINGNIIVKAFLDNDSKKWSNRINEKEILKPKKEIINQVDYIIISSDWKEEIIKQLLDMGIEESKILIAY